MPAAADSGLALNVPGCAIFSLPALFVDLEIQQFEDVLAPGDRAAGQAAGEDFRQCRQVRADAVGLLRAARRDAEPVDDLVEDQQHAVLGGQPAQRVQEIRVDRQFAAIGAGRLDDRGGDLALVLFQQPRQRRFVVLVAQQHVAGDRIEHAGRRRAVEMICVARRHVVVPAVEMIIEADQLRLAGEGAREPHRHQRRLGAGRGEAHPLGGRDQRLDPLGPFDLQLVAGAVMGAAVELRMHRRHHLGMAMAEQQRAVAAEIIDVARGRRRPICAAPWRA